MSNNKYLRYFSSKYLLYIFCRIISDRSFVKYKFRISMGYPLNLDNPKTFNEKLQWLKLNDRKPEYTYMVDKVEVKKMIASFIGEQHIIPTIAVYNRAEDVNFASLPDQFVIKTTHDSGGVIICHNKDSLDISEVIKKLKKRLSRNCFWYNREWPYKNVRPRIIVEKLIGEEGTELKDYKFMCYNGKCKNLFVCSGRGNNDLRVDFFDTKWHHLPFQRKYPNADNAIQMPDNLEEMINLSESIAKIIDCPFVRVDLYSIKGNVYFGELTFYPGSGLEWFNPKEWDERLGELICLPKKYN